MIRTEANSRLGLSFFVFAHARTFPSQFQNFPMTSACGSLTFLSQNSRHDNLSEKGGEAGKELGDLIRSLLAAMTTSQRKEVRPFAGQPVSLSTALGNNTITLRKETRS